MRLKKLLVSFLLLLVTNANAQFEQQIKHVLHIRTDLKFVTGAPTWLIEVRDVKTGRILPFIYDIEALDNHWIAFSSGHAYKVIASRLKFAPGLYINNFCCLENGIIEGKSLVINLTGTLTPYRKTSRCKVTKIVDSQFVIDP